MREYLASLRLFVVATLKRWWALLAAVLTALGVLQVGFGVSVSIPTPVAFGSAGIMWFLAAGAAYHEQRMRMRQGSTNAAWARLEPVMHDGAELLNRLRQAGARTRDLSYMVPSIRELVVRLST